MGLFWSGASRLRTDITVSHPFEEPSNSRMQTPPPPLSGKGLEAGVTIVVCSAPLDILVYQTPLDYKLSLA